jgi:hypothetical protein
MGFCGCEFIRTIFSGSFRVARANKFAPTELRDSLTSPPFTKENTSFPLHRGGHACGLSSGLLCRPLPPLQGGTEGDFSTERYNKDYYYWTLRAHSALPVCGPYRINSNKRRYISQRRRLIIIGGNPKKNERAKGEGEKGKKTKEKELEHEYRESAKRGANRSNSFVFSLVSFLTCCPTAI